VPIFTCVYIERHRPMEPDEHLNAVEGFSSLMKAKHWAHDYSFQEAPLEWEEVDSTCWYSIGENRSFIIREHD
jgi:hypothetical protein